MLGIQLAFFGILDVTATSGGGGGGGGGGSFAGWDNISASANFSPYTDVIGSNSDETIPNSGTINIAHTGSSILRVIKNGTTYTGVSSLAVANGDLVHFSAEIPTLPYGSTVTETVTVTGIVSDTFTITLSNGV